MFGLILIFFVGKYYYELAQDYYKNRWVYGIFGILMYYLGTALGGLTIGFLDYALNLNVDFSQFNLIIIGLLFGTGLAAAVYFFLYFRWKWHAPLKNDDIDKIGKN